MQKLLSLAVIGLMFLSGSVAAAKDISNSPEVVIIDQASEMIGRVVTTLVRPAVDPKDLECLARNIFYESGSEPREGKIAVGMVTINRSQHDKYPGSICAVVNQRTKLEVPRQVKTVLMVKDAWYKSPERRESVRTVWDTITVCQFSWSCMRVTKPRSDDERWIESREVAYQLLDGGYEDYQSKYGNLISFHARYIRPAWNNLKRVVTIGGHVFYAEK